MANQSNVAAWSASEKRMTRVNVAGAPTRCSSACGASQRRAIATLTIAMRATVGTPQERKIRQFGATATIATSMAIFATEKTTFSERTHGARPIPTRTLSWSTNTAHAASVTRKRADGPGPSRRNARLGDHTWMPARNTPPTANAVSTLRA